MIPYTTKVKGLLIYAMYPENAKSMFAPMCHAFKMQPKLHIMQPKLHNSADQGISKFVYLEDAGTFGTYNLSGFF